MQNDRLTAGRFFSANDKQANEWFDIHCPGSNILK